MKKLPVSVIVPIYNKERYLWKCIESILHQTFTQFELILVNDGSKDRCLDICKYYAEKDSRIVIIDKENAGLSSARRAGVLRAKGEYIFICDSDDYVVPHAIETLYKLAKEKDLDLAAANFERVFDNWGLFRRKNSPFCYADRVIEGDEIKTIPLLFDLSSFEECIWTAITWSRVYRRQCFIDAMKEDDELLFSKIRMNDDIMLNMILFPYMKRIYIINESLYKYRYGGITQTPIMITVSGARYYDVRYDYCLRYGYEEGFVSLFSNFVITFMRDIRFLIRCKKESEEAFSALQEEMNKRKVMAWARNSDEIRNSSNRVWNMFLENRMDDIILEGRALERAMGWRHKLKYKIRWYQKLADFIASTAYRLRKQL